MNDDELLFKYFREDFCYRPPIYKISFGVFLPRGQSEGDRLVNSECVNIWRNIILLHISNLI